MRGRRDVEQRARQWVGGADLARGGLKGKDGRTSTARRVLCIGWALRKGLWTMRHACVMWLVGDVCASGQRG